jgi:hypothetical protein
MIPSRTILMDQFASHGTTHPVGETLLSILSYLAFANQPQSTTDQS